jgi:hypothetical protein
VKTFFAGCGTGGKASIDTTIICTHIDTTIICTHALDEIKGRQDVEALPIMLRAPAARLHGPKRNPVGMASVWSRVRKLGLLAILVLFAQVALNLAASAYAHRIRSWTTYVSRDPARLVVSGEALSPLAKFKRVKLFLAKTPHNSD